MRIIAKSHFDAHTDPIFKNPGILKFHDIHLLHLGLFMYSHQNQTLPSKFACKFTLNRQIHSYHTRNSHTFRLLFCRTNIKNFLFFTKDLSFTTLLTRISSIRPNAWFNFTCYHPPRATPGTSSALRSRGWGIV